MSALNELVEIITRHQVVKDLGVAEATAKTILDELLVEEWMVADMDGDEISGGSIHEGSEAEVEARATHARYIGYGNPELVNHLLRRVVGPWERVDEGLTAR